MNSPKKARAVFAAIIVTLLANYAIGSTASEENSLVSDTTIGRSGSGTSTTTPRPERSGSGTNTTTPRPIAQ